jgi:hypothetical protein
MIMRQWREMPRFELNKGGAMLAMSLSVTSFVLLRY